MNKAEMEEHRQQYDACMARCSAAAHHRFYFKAIAEAVSALPFADGMMRHAEKYENAKFTNLAAFELILKYAPLLLDTESLDQLERVLDQQRRIERNTSADLGALLLDARRRLNECYQLWSLLESRASIDADELAKLPGGDQKPWASIAEEWRKMELIRQIPEGRSINLAIVSKLDRVCRGKCGSCGGVKQAAQWQLLNPVQCLNCRKASIFTLLSD